jgi:hypothetical protein
MVARNALVQIGGDIKELPAGDTLNGGGGGGSPAVTVAVTFPAAGATVITQSVTVTGATVGQKVICSAVNDTDELEMDMLVCAGVVSAADTVKLTVASVGQAHHGARNINIQRS